MAYKVEDLNNSHNFRQVLAVNYADLIPFIFKYLKNVTFVTILFWLFCLVFLFVALWMRTLFVTSLNTIGYSILGFIILPVLIIPFHEALHIIPYYITGARDIRMGMDLKQFLFYVTAHRYVASPSQFIFVALVPFVLISITVIVLIFILPGTWKWSLSAFLFVHATMCAGDAPSLISILLTEIKKYTPGMMRMRKWRIFMRDWVRGRLGDGETG
ncbi:MAG: DUF3267 domain-containing protein [Bacteroidetes bacterium]|nr:DUF3267 domain-containing protein [Bacteroidota bacterium]